MANIGDGVFQENLFDQQIENFIDEEGLQMKSL